MGKAVSIVVEDVLSEAILATILNVYGGHKVAASYPVKSKWKDGVPQNGYGYIKKNLPAFNKAADDTPFVILVDEDDRNCPPKTIADWLGGQPKHSNLIVRIASKEVEAWLLADKQGFSEFLSISDNKIPDNPETVEDPKALIVQLALRSKSSEIRHDIAPIRGGSATTGPYYTRALSGFARKQWNIGAAVQHSQSLKRAIADILRL